MYFLNFVFLLFMASIYISGCAINYYDADTGAQHLFGIGHMVMKIEQGESRPVAVFSGLSTIGVAAGSTVDGYSFNGGWAYHQSIHVLRHDASFNMLWPNADWLNIKVGSWPDQLSAEHK